MVTRGYVSHQMIRMLFFCCKTNKVDDDHTVAVPNTKEDTVFVYLSPNILTRGILGKLIIAMEDKGLRSTAIEFKVPDAIHLKNSILAKSLNKGTGGLPSVFTLWTGRDALVRVKEVITSIGNQYGVAKVDIVFTETAQQTKKEIEVWFEHGTIAPVPEANGTPPSAEDRKSETDTHMEEVDVPVQLAPIIEVAVPDSASQPRTARSIRDSPEVRAETASVKDHPVALVEEHVLHVAEDVEEVHTVPLDPAGPTPIIHAP